MNDFQLRQAVKVHSSSEFLDHYYLEWYTLDIRYHIYLGCVRKLSPSITKGSFVKLIQTYTVEDSLGLTTKRKQGYQAIVNRYIELEINKPITESIKDSKPHNLVTLKSYTAKHLALTRLVQDFYRDNKDWIQQLDPELLKLQWKMPNL